MRLRSLAVAFLMASSAHATTMVQVEHACPVGGAKFSTVEAASISGLGMRLDLSLMAPAFGPTECPNGFVLFKMENEFTPDEIAKLTPVVASDEYRKARHGESVYYRTMLLERALGESDAELRDLFMAAAFDAEYSHKAQHRKYLTLAQAAYGAFLAQHAEHDEDWWVAALRRAEIARQLGRFKDAERRVLALLKMGRPPQDYMLGVADQIGQAARLKFSEPLPFEEP